MSRSGAPDQLRCKKTQALAEAESHHRAPCDACSQRNLCRTEVLCCRAYAAWMRSGHLPKRASYIPLRWVYEWAFQTEDQPSGVQRNRTPVGSVPAIPDSCPA